MIHPCSRFSWNPSCIRARPRLSIPRPASREPKRVFSVQSKGLPDHPLHCTLSFTQARILGHPYTAIRAELLIHGSNPPLAALPSTHPVSRIVPPTLRNGYGPDSSFLYTQLNGICMSYPILNPVASFQPPYDGEIAHHEYLSNDAFRNHVPAGLSSFALAFSLCSPSTHSSQPRTAVSPALGPSLRST